MSGNVRVLLYHTATDVSAVSALEAAYHESSERLDGAPGLLRNELLRSVAEPDGFVVVSFWRSLEEFESWERGTDHKRQTAPLRPFRDTRMTRPFGIYQVMASY